MRKVGLPVFRSYQVALFHFASFMTSKNFALEKCFDIRGFSANQALISVLSSRKCPRPIVIEGKVLVSKTRPTQGSPALLTILTKSPTFNLYSPLFLYALIIGDWESRVNNFFHLFVFLLSPVVFGDKASFDCCLLHSNGPNHTSGSFCLPQRQRR